MALTHGLGQLHNTVDSMRRFQGGNDALELRQGPKSLHGLRVRGGDKPRALVVLPRRQLRPDPGVIQTGGNRMRLGDLPVLVLQHVRAHAVQDAFGAAAERRRVAGRVDAVPAGLHAQELDGGVVGERVEHADGVTAAADAGDDRVGQFPDVLVQLLLGLVADDGLEGAHDGGERVRADGRADDVVSRGEVDDPGAEGLVDGVAQRAAACFDGDDGRAQQFHAEDVEGLAPHVFRAHVHHALHAELGADGGGGHAVLAGAGLGDDARLAQSPCEQDLAQGVVDLVAARVVEVFTFQPDVGSADVRREPVRQVQAAGPAHVRVVRAVLVPELGVMKGLVEALFQLGHAVHQRLGHVLSSELAEPRRLLRWVPGAVQRCELVGQAGPRRRVCVRHHVGRLRDGGLLLHKVNHVGLADYRSRGGVPFQLTTRHAGQVLLCVLGRLARRCLAQNRDDLTANHHALRQILHGQEMLPSADAEP